MDLPDCIPADLLPLARRLAAVGGVIYGRKVITLTFSDEYETRSEA